MKRLSLIFLFFICAILCSGCGRGKDAAIRMIDNVFGQINSALFDILVYIIIFIIMYKVISTILDEAINSDVFLRNSMAKTDLIMTTISALISLLLAFMAKTIVNTIANLAIQSLRQ